MATFATRLRLALQGHSRKKVCKALGVDPRSMTSWLNGLNLPGSKSLTKLCLELNVSADWLLGLPMGEEVETS